MEQNLVSLFSHKLLFLLCHISFKKIIFYGEKFKRMYGELVATCIPIYFHALIYKMEIIIVLILKVGGE